MNDHFCLQPFSPPKSQQATASLLPDLKVTGNIARSTNTLAIDYKLLDPLTEVVIPPLADKPVRKNELWQETCFEFFLGIKNLERYWEFNLSPAGHWNIYRFDAYRQGMQEEIAFTSLPFSIQHQSNALLLALKLDLAKLVQADQTLVVAISTVIKHRNSDVTYWALTHPGSQADFHRRDSFIVEL